MTSNVLARLGLNKNELKCFGALLEHGEQTAARISKDTGISRTNVYHLLLSLEEKGIIEKSGVAKKTVFRCCHPEALGLLLDREEARIKEARSLLQTELPRLAMSFALGDNRSGVYRFEGIDGLQRVYTELIRDRKPIDSILNRGLLWNIVPDFNQNFIKQRIKYRIKNRAICVDNEDSSKVDAAELREVRYIEMKQLPLTLDFRITSKKVVITTLTGGEVVGIILNDSSVTKNFGLLFEFLWGIAKP